MPYSKYLFFFFQMKKKFLKTFMAEVSILTLEFLFYLNKQ